MQQVFPFWLFKLIFVSMVSKAHITNDIHSSNMPPRIIDFHTCLKLVGDFGLYQKLLCIFLFFNAVYVSSTYWTQILLVATPKHWCKIMPPKEHVASIKSCSIILNQTDSFSEVPFDSPGSTMKLPCPDGWEYDFSVLFQTVATERNWVCENNWFVYASQTFFWIGSSVGFIVWGAVSDRYGRRTALCFMYSMGVVANAITFWLPNNTFFVITRFFVGFSSFPITLVLYAFGIEFASPNKRTTIGAAYIAGFVAGLTAIPWFASYIRDWRIITLCPCVLACILLVFTKWLLESASWLLTRRENDKAKEVLNKLAGINSMALPDFFKKCEIVTGISNRQVSSDGFLQTTLSLVKSPVYRRRTLSLLLLAFATSFCCYGLLFHISKLDINFYLMYSISGLIDVPSSLYSAILLDRVGRRWSIFSSNFLGGVTSLTLFLVTDGLSRLSSPVIFTMEMGALMFADMSVNLLIQYGQELFPTAIRGRGVCLQRAVAEIGGCIGSQAVRLSDRELLLPQLAFGVVSILSGFIVLMLPETAKQQLPITIEDGEKFGRDQDCCFCPCLDGRKRDQQESLNRLSLDQSDIHA